MTDKLKLATVDDHTIFREGLKTIISLKPEMEIVIEATNGKDFIDQLQNTIPDIVLLDISMPEMDGLECTKAALKLHPDLKIIVLSMHNEEDYYYKMIEAGVMGFVLKNANLEELYHAIDEVAVGNNYFSQSLLKKIVLRINKKPAKELNKLTEKETTVLTHICNGFTNKEIAEKLFLSIKTIEKYRNNLLKKTSTRNTAHLVMHAIKNKLISVD